MALHQAVCQLYNPYFKSDCALGDQCPLAHYSSEQYSTYCSTINKYNVPDETAISQYNEYMTYWSNGEYNQCLKILKNLIFNYPFNAAYHSSIAKTYSKLKQDYLACIHYKRSIAIQPNNPKYHMNFAIYANGKNANIVAKNHFILALLSIETNSMYQNCNEFIAKLHGLYAKFLIDTEHDIVMSKHHYTMSLKYHDSPRTHYDFARLLHGEMDIENAEIHYLKSLRISSIATNDIKYLLNNSFQRRFNYALLLKQAMKYKEAQQQFEIALKLTKHENNEILNHYGLLLCENLNCYELGLKYLKSASLDGDKEEYTNIYKYYQQKWDQMQLLKQQGIILGINEINVDIIDITENDENDSVSDTYLTLGCVKNSYN